MATLDYKKLNLKVGLEIHFQIDSDKLFCRCPSILRDDKPDIKIKRYLRPVPSEMGEMDIVAEFEMAKKRYAIYEAYNNTTCLVELDESPAEPIDEVALKTALEVAMLLNCKIVDELQIMRKQVLDFSNTSGFQRSGLLAMEGYVETSSGKVGIQTVMLEEDAARKIKETKNYVVYRLDRLGIPLIEIATAPDIKTPEQAREVAEHIGMIVKSTGKKRAGVGTIRQDVNVSVSKGARVEIKGVQDLNSIPKVIENEVRRQLSIIKKGKKVVSEVRNANPDNTTSYLRPMPGAARLYVETDVPTIKITEEMLSRIKIPELLTERVINIEKKYNLSPQLARELIKRNIDFKAYVKKFSKIKPKLIAQVLVEIPKDIKKRHNLDVNKLKEEDFNFVLKLLNENKISKDAIPEILIAKVKGIKIDLSKYKKVSEKKLEKDIENIIKKNKDASVKALMGIIMGKYKGIVEGKKVVRLLNKMIK